jgi:hypothetical protein
VKRILLDSKNILSFLLSVFVFIVLVDPTNTIFKIKGLVFILLVALSALHYSTVKYSGFIVLSLVTLIIITTYILGHFLGYHLNNAYAIGVLKGFSTLIFLLWIEKFRVIDKFIFPTLVICVVTVLTFLIFQYSPKLSDELYKFYMDHDATLMIGKRTFLGLNVMSFFYKTLPVLLLPLSIYSYKFFNAEEKGLKNLLIMLLLMFTIFLSGTRASMLAGVLVFAVNFVIWLNRTNLGKLTLIPLVIAFTLTFGFITLSLITEKGEGSNKVKYANLDSYSELFIKHPIILVTGQGAGSLFYSKGRKEMVLLTEWSYLEIIRMFGLIGAFIVVVLFFFPLYLIYCKRKKLKYWIPFFMGYFLYLLVGGTNPLLLGSTGMIVLLAGYSFSLNPNYELRKW